MKLVLSALAGLLVIVSLTGGYFYTVYRLLKRAT